MRVGCVADVHVGNHRVHGGPVEAGLNRRCREVVATLRAAVEKAVTLGCGRFVVAGDLFDTCEPEPQVVRAVQDALDSPMPTYVLLGNHDMHSTEPGDHALGPLGKLANVTVVERPQCVGLGDDSELLLVPFRPGPAKVWLPEALASIPRLCPVRDLVLHLGIADANTPPWLRDCHDAVTAVELFAEMGKLGVGLAVAGNWHDHKRWEVRGRRIVQCGALAPTGFDNPGPDGYGSLIVWDTWNNGAPPVRHEVPGPRFFTVKDADAARDARGLAKGCSRYLRWKVDPALELPSVARAFVEGLVADGEFVAGEAVLDAPDPRATARVAATAAAGAVQGAEAGQGAVAAYVAGLDLPEGVARADVLAVVSRLLAAAA